MRNGKGFDAILKSQEVFLTPEEVGTAAGWSPSIITATAHNNPALLGFPVVCIGVRTYIPRLPFLEYIGMKDLAQEMARRRLASEITE